MTRATVPPYYFPTTVGFVDDNAGFLANLSLQLDTQLAFRFFGSAEQALAAIEQAPATAVTDHFLRRHDDRPDTNDGQELIAMRIDTITRQVLDGKRFECVSVMVVDYDMPGMDGLEFCRRITNPAIRKIMLTGKADEHLAVQGFNDGIIDRFIRKQDPDAIAVLNQSIEELKDACLRHMQRTIIDTLSLSEYRFLNDSAFAMTVSQIFRQLGIVEHYLSVRPGGLLMLDSAATPYLLAVYTEDALRGTREIAAELRAPRAFFAELDTRRSIPYFWQSGGLFPAGDESWRDHMYPSFVVGEQETYACALIERPAGFGLGKIVSYSEYLDRLDREAFSIWGSSV